MARAAFCAVGLQGPLRQAEGKGVKRSDHRERSSQSLPLRWMEKQVTEKSVTCFVLVVVSEQAPRHHQKKKNECLSLFVSIFFLSAANAKISLVRFGYITNGVN